jgi:hypothetical protein
LARWALLTAEFIFRRPAPVCFERREPTTGKKPTEPSVLAWTGTPVSQRISCLPPEGFGAVFGIARPARTGM